MDKKLTEKRIIDVLIERKEPLSIDFMEELDNTSEIFFKKTFIKYLGNYMLKEFGEKNITSMKAGVNR